MGEKGEEGAKDSSLWDSRAHVYLTRLAFFYQHFLCSIGQKMFNPEVGASSNSILIKFVQGLMVRDSVKSLVV